MPLVVVSDGDEIPVPDAWRSAEIATAINSFTDLRSAARELERALDRQRIVWVEGLYLPQELTVAPDRGVVSVAN